MKNFLLIFALQLVAFFGYSSNLDNETTNIEYPNAIEIDYEFEAISKEYQEFSIPLFKGFENTLIVVENIQNEFLICFTSYYSQIVANPKTKFCSSSFKEEALSEIYFLGACSTQSYSARTSIIDSLFTCQIYKEGNCIHAESLTYPNLYSDLLSTISLPLSVEKVVICGGAYSKKYHKNSTCNGLTNCKGGLYEVSKSEALNKGRTACSICY
jgi:hypothetical protein